VSTQYALWALRGIVKIKKMANDLLTLWNNRVRGNNRVRDKFENQKTFPIPFAPEDVFSFIFNHRSFSLKQTIYRALGHKFRREKLMPLFLHMNFMIRPNAAKVKRSPEE
jgi:hypothetical protein